VGYFEAGIGATCLAAVLGYHLYFLRELRRRPNQTTLGRAKSWRQLWVARMIERKDYILAVQTLRNMITSASFLASTAMLITAGLLGFLSSTGKEIYLIHEFNFLGGTDNTILTAKLLALLVNFLLSFFNFSMCIRYYNYLALLIPIASPDADDEPARSAAHYFARGAVHYALGMRGFYFALPIVLWLFGPIWLGLGTIVLLIALYRHDHAH
jgi:uncharacterized membrane protein